MDLTCIWSPSGNAFFSPDRCQKQSTFQIGWMYPPDHRYWGCTFACDEHLADVIKQIDAEPLTIRKIK